MNRGINVYKLIDIGCDTKDFLPILTKGQL